MLAIGGFGGRIIAGSPTIAALSCTTVSTASERQFARTEVTMARRAAADLRFCNHLWFFIAEYIWSLNNNDYIYTLDDLYVFIIMLVSVPLTPSGQSGAICTIGCIECSGNHGPYHLPKHATHVHICMVNWNIDTYKVCTLCQYLSGAIPVVVLAFSGWQR